MSTVKEEHAAATNILLRKQVNTLRERIKQLSKTNSKLKQQSRVGEKDTNDFVEYFQNEINFLNEKNLELQAQIAMLVKESKDFRERSQREHQEVVDALKAEARETEAKLQEKILSLTSQLEDVEQFRQEKGFMLDQLETLRSSLVQSEEKKREEIAGLERKFLEEKQRLQGEYDTKIVQVEKSAADAAMKKLDRRVKLLFIEHDQTVEELRLQKEANEDLKDEVKQLNEKVKVLNREQALFDQERDLSARAGARKTLDLDAKAEKIQSLEKALAKQVARADAEQYRLQKAYDHDVGELRLEVQGLRQLIKLKSREFRRMKHLAQTVLDQRSQTETFFNECLDRVRKEKAEIVAAAEQAERKDRARQVREANLRAAKCFPSVRKTVDAGEEEERPKHGPVTYKDLSLPDKERILELLFARINNQQRELRAHSPVVQRGVGLRDDERAAATRLNEVEDEVDRLAKSTHNTPRNNNMKGDTPSVINMTMGGEASYARPEME